MQGRIIKGVAGQYQVSTTEGELYVCKAKGIFRKEKESPMVGDLVEISILDEKTKEGSIQKIFPRKNKLIRPFVSNIDQALVVFAVSNPKPNFQLLDRFIINMMLQKIECVILFGKEDLGQEDELDKWKEDYAKCGCKVLTCSVKEKKGILEIRNILKGRITTLAGPSGVGKSSLINELQSDVVMEVGTISEKIDRGKHTTRHSQLIPLSEDTFILDTPGFSSLDVFDMSPEKLSDYYPEFEPYLENCKFIGCTHIHEPVCGVKEALEKGEISKLRYENYATLYRQLKEEKKKY